MKARNFCKKKTKISISKLQRFPPKVKFPGNEMNACHLILVMTEIITFTFIYKFENGLISNKQCKGKSLGFNLLLNSDCTFFWK